MKEVEIALIEYINSKPEGHLLREIAERQLLDIRNKGLMYVDPAENNKLGLVKRTYTSPKRKLSVDELKDNTSHNCRYLRIRQGLSQWKFGKKIGISERSCNHYESKHIVMPLVVVLNLCIIYNLSVETFTTQKLPIKKAPK